MTIESRTSPLGECGFPYILPIGNEHPPFGRAGVGVIFLTTLSLSAMQQRRAAPVQ